MKRLVILIAFILLTSLSARAQTFNSGSTGADGPLDLTSGDRKVQLPESGVLNYTTVNIPAGRGLTFKRNSRNTPVIMLAQGTVTISGVINVTNVSDPDTPPFLNTPGPGGFYGGAPGQPGFGPGGGPGTGDTRGKWMGPLSLVPIIGGSGGGNNGYGGGGAIVIASSTSINSSGSIYAYSQNSFGSGGPHGGGGAIRLVANSINVSGNLLAFSVNGSTQCSQCAGVIRIEAPTGTLTFTGTADPPAVLSAINPIVISSTPPALTIVSIGGFPVPSSTGQRFNTVDLLLPSQLADPISVVVQGNNIPVGTSVSIGSVNGSPGATSTSSTLQGTFASSTASPTISALNRSIGTVTYLLASATFAPPPPAAPFNQKGANYVEKVRVESLIGEKAKFIFLRKDGSEIKPEMLAREFLQQFGQ